MHINTDSGYHADPCLSTNTCKIRLLSHRNYTKEYIRDTCEFVGYSMRMRLEFHDRFCTRYSLTKFSRVTGRERRNKKKCFHICRFKLYSGRERNKKGCSDMNIPFCFASRDRQTIWYSCRSSIVVTFKHGSWFSISAITSDINRIRICHELSFL